MLAELASVDLLRLPRVEGNPRFGALVSSTSKFIAIGTNYSDHAKEANLPIPSEPLVFIKATTCIGGANDDIVQPVDSTKLEWKLELGIVVGKKAQYVAEDDALDYGAGYCIVNDVSECAFQFQTSQWGKGKGCDTFAPIGLWLVTKDEVPDPQNLDMWLDVNGKRMQTGNSATMIFNLKQIVAQCSRYMTLLPDDVITTGTPPGIGMDMKPEPVWLKPGDVITLGIQGY